MGGRFPLYTDADIYGPLVDALVERGWDLVRAVDVLPEGARDNEHFERAARDARVLVAHDWHQRQIAQEWIKAGRPFRGLMTWAQNHHERMTVSDFLEAFDALASEEEPFAYPIRYINPKR